MRKIHLRGHVQFIGNSKIEHMQRHRDTHPTDGHICRIIPGSSCRWHRNTEPECRVLALGNTHRRALCNRPQWVGVRSGAPQAVTDLCDIHILHLVDFGADPAAKFPNVDRHIPRGARAHHHLKRLELILRRIHLHSRASRRRDCRVLEDPLAGWSCPESISAGRLSQPVGIGFGVPIGCGNHAIGRSWQPQLKDSDQNDYGDDFFHWSSLVKDYVSPASKC